MQKNIKKRCPVTFGAVSVIHLFALQRAFSVGNKTKMLLQVASLILVSVQLVVGLFISVAALASWQSRVTEVHWHRG